MKLKDFIHDVKKLEPGQWQTFKPGRGLSKDRIEEAILKLRNLFPLEIKIQPNPLDGDYRQCRITIKKLSSL